MRHFTALTLILGLTLCTLSSCHSHCPDQDIVIFFDNDVHCSVEGYAKLASLKDQVLERTPYVAVVSAGDFAQGSTIGSLSKGEYIVEIMNQVPYDVVTLGNHEFDYTIPQLYRLCNQLTADVVCCNFRDLNEKKDVFLPFSIRKFGKTKVAFVGVATPETLNSSTPTYFQDENGNFVYSFYPNNTYQQVQKAVNAARRKGADYVFVLSHLGDDTENWNSVELIKATKGIDAVFDGHQHHVLNLHVANANGDSVILASTGCNMAFVGTCAISKEGKVSAQLVPSKNVASESNVVMHKVIEMTAALMELTNKDVGTTLVDLTTNDENGFRAVRCKETNLGDFVADAVRYATHSDIGVINGGGLRRTIDKGNITIGDVYALLPFNNRVLQAEATGQQILDAMEVSLALAPAESGSFMQVSGMRFTYDPSIPSSVIYDDHHFFIGIGETRRIVSMEVEKNGKWLPIDPEATYTIGGQNYFIHDKGADGIFSHMKETNLPPTPDTQVLIDYIRHLGGIVTEKQYGKIQNRIVAL